MDESRCFLTEEDKKSYAGIYLLDHMIHSRHSFPLLLEGNDQDLEPVLEWLLIKEYVEIKENLWYAVSDNGKKALARFMARYTEYLKIFDVFCAVDLLDAEFAFASYYKFADKDNWLDFLSNERWDDLRVAVADYKGMNPIEIIFMSFLNENRFGRDDSGWQFDLLLGTVWDEILDVCLAAIKWQDLGYEDEAGKVAAGDVVEDIIRQGIDIMIDLHGDEDEILAYRDPGYLSPAWVS